MSKAILSIDDSPSIRQMITLTLSGAGYRVDTACDGAEGYHKAVAGPYSAIITDQNMPNMTGIEFIRKFRAHPSSRGVPIIFLSTESDPASKQAAKEAGAIGWIVKPFNQDQLIAAVRKVAGA
ncbi:response regulator [Halovulum dunhuangense]|uniref:Response regulator n=1 Tax=Halovulum dunhuangense TaxID=1505036 RepID=A0A849L1C9_9RHOB|nr:response regulator [Halovulum dunhuangense]NNU80073.1 response regulator [Halovulum dunhuangense]